MNSVIDNSSGKCSSTHYLYPRRLKQSTSILGKKQDYTEIYHKGKQIKRSERWKIEISNEEDEDIGN